MLESMGVAVVRISIRGWNEPLTDDEDLLEQRKTRYVLKAGIPALLWAAMIAFLRNPYAMFRAIVAALAMTRRSDRSWIVHLAYTMEACMIARWVEEYDCDHIHAHFGTNPAEVAMLTSELSGRPFSFTVHGCDEFDRPIQLGLNRLVSKAAFVAAISFFTKSQLLRWADEADWPKITLVRCGVDHSFLRAPATKVPDTSQFLCVGRLCPAKGQLLLVDAIALLRDKGIFCRVVLAGDGELRASIERRIARYQLTDRVKITSWVNGEQVRELILASRALVLPSFAEGLPVVLMEALALKRPVISTYIAGIPELVEPEYDGWLVPAGEVHALAEAMATCLQTPAEQLTRMGEAGHIKVRLMHDARQEAARLYRLFDQGVDQPDLVYAAS